MGRIEQHLLGLVSHAVHRARGKAWLIDNIDGRHGSGLEVQLAGFKFNLILANVEHLSRKDKR